MSLQSIKKNYASLLKVFSELGVKINESQKETLDGFITDIEKTIDEQTDLAIVETKKVVEQKLEREYRTVFESIMKHQQENSELAEKIQTKISDSKKNDDVVDAVDEYLSEYVKEILPKKTIVDYARMQKLEKIQDSLKELLEVSELDVDNKAQEMKCDLEKKNKELRDKVSLYESKMCQSTNTLEKMSKEISSLKAREFVREKTKNLPLFESKLILAKTNGMCLEELEKNYDKILNTVKDEIASEQTIKEEDTKNLEEAISEILDGKKDASTETKSDKEIEGQVSNPEPPDENMDEVVPNEEPEENGSVQITESQMQEWISTLYRITPQR